MISRDLRGLYEHEGASADPAWPIDALQAELHRWDTYLDRMQAKAAAKSAMTTR